mmetsp:Transcript_56229/g.131708  ORF Transcript_56229/g.131708 Transcript_56229/m.131708 type:complete len:168 (+) Transcript_56229:82-585(+)
MPFSLADIVAKAAFKKRRQPPTDKGSNRTIVLQPAGWRDASNTVGMHMATSTASTSSAPLMLVKTASGSSKESIADSARRQGLNIHYFSSGHYQDSPAGGESTESLSGSARGISQDVLDRLCVDEEMQDDSSSCSSVTDYFASGVAPSDYSPLQTKASPKMPVRLSL